MQSLSTSGIFEGLVQSLRISEFCCTSIGSEFLWFCINKLGSVRQPGNDEIELKNNIIKFRNDEIEHKNIAYEQGATKKGIYFM